MGQGGGRRQPSPGPAVAPEALHGDGPLVRVALPHPAGQAEHPQLLGRRRREGEVAEVRRAPEAAGVAPQGADRAPQVGGQRGAEGGVDAEEAGRQPPAVPGQHQSGAEGADAVVALRPDGAGDVRAVTVAVHGARAHGVVAGGGPPAGVSPRLRLENDRPPPGSQPHAPAPRR